MSEIDYKFDHVRRLLCQMEWKFLYYEAVLLKKDKKTMVQRLVVTVI